MFDTTFRGLISGETRWFARLDFYFFSGGRSGTDLDFAYEKRSNGGDGRVTNLVSFLGGGFSRKGFFYEGMMDAAQGRCPFTFHFTTNILPYIFNFGRYPFFI